MSRNSDPGPVPDRWLHCPRKSSGLIADKFLAFKTPLSHRFDSQVSDIFRFTPRMLLECTKSYKYRLGLWIDLTNTRRFYKKDEVENGYDDGSEVRYLKLQCRGHGETPNDEQIKTFIKVCSTFIRNQPTEVIGVHCTHGFNRTGFLIVCFLVEELNWGLDAALQEFTKKREPGIYKQDYIDELYRRYEPDEDSLAAPPRPSWCLEYDDDDREPERPSQQNVSRPEKRRHDSRDNRGRNKRQHIAKDVEFMDGAVGGVFKVTDHTVIEKVQTSAQDMCQWDKGGFPGSQPVSLDRKNIELLCTTPYTVSWKADGIRYMMVILGENEVYMIDRDNTVYEVEGLKFLDRKNLDRHLTKTLLDGEMVIDRFQGQNIPRYLVYDVIYCNDMDVSQYPFSPARQTCIDVDIIKPRHKAMEMGKIIKQNEPFSVRAKMFCSIDKAASFLGEKFSNQLTHEPDGLIFQPCEDPYVTGQSPRVLKWKPPSHNSIDFRLKIEKEEGEGILTRKVGNLYVGGRTHFFARMKWTKDLEQYNNKIIECRYDSKTKKWIMMRERTDKSFPNSDRTAQSVWDSIMHPVTKEDLLKIIANSRYRTDKEKMPPPPPRLM